MPTDRRAASTRLAADLRAALGELLCLGRQRLAQAGISMGQIHLLSMLARHGAMPMGRIAEVLDSSMSSATGIVDRMADHGLVERVRVPSDRRVVLVEVTEAGRRTLADLELLRDDMVADVLDRLDERQLARVEACAADLRGAITAMLADHPDHFAHDHQLPGDAPPVPSPDQPAAGSPA